MLPVTIQLQYLSECINQDELSPVDEDQFTEPWRLCYQIMSACERVNAYQTLIQRLMLMPWDDEWPTKETITQQIRNASDSPLAFPALEKLAETLEPITWLWKNWIPRGMLSLMGGTPGAGKSYLGLDLAKRITDPAATFPDESAIPAPGGNVIYVDAEAVPQLLNERAQTWQMDTSKLYIMLPDEYSWLDLTTPEHQERLITMAHVIQPELIIIDSLSSISTRGENSIEDVRSILSFLSQTASNYDCGLLLIHHLRKRSSAPLFNMLSIDDFRGSSHIVAMARSVLGLSVIQEGATLDRNGPRQLEIIKTNLACYPPALGVRFEQLEPTGVLLQYGDPPQAYKEPSQVDLCARWMLEVLEEYGQPLRPGEVVELAEEDGYSQSVVYRARKALGDAIINTGGFRDPTNRWGTPEGVAAWEQERQTEARADAKLTKEYRCADWLLETLAQNGKSMSSAELISLAAEAGYSKGVFYRSCDLLSDQIIKPARGVWQLAA